MQILKYSGFLFTLLLAGCSNDPLSSLKDDQPSLKYPESFWDQEQKNNTPLWEKAKQICAQEDAKNKPNCAGIHDIEMFEHPMAYPKYGTGKGFGAENMPKLK